MAEKAGQFSKSVVTQLGKGMIVESQNGKILSFTRIALGDGLIEDGEDIEKLTSIKKENLSCPIRSFVDKGNGQFALQFEVSNAALEKGFWHREIGVMAKIGAGAEQLYAYSYAGTAASFLYDKTTPIQERIVKIDVVVGNTENLTVVIDSSIIHPTMAEVDARLTEHNESPNAHQDIREAITAHRTAAELDHPEKSVRKKHLHQDVYESPALTGTPTAPTAGRGTNNGQIASTAFVSQAITALVDKSGDTMTGALKFDRINVACLIGSLLNGNAWRIFNGHGNAHTGFLAFDITNEDTEGIFLRKFNKDFSREIIAATLLDSENNTAFPGVVSAAGGFTGNLKGTASNSDNVGNKSLQWILDQINAAKTGIVASNLAQNGWVKFANGLIVQWGVGLSVNKEEERVVDFPIKFPSLCFGVWVTTVIEASKNHLSAVNGEFQVISANTAQCHLFFQLFTPSSQPAAPSILAIGI